MIKSNNILYVRAKLVFNTYDMNYETPNYIVNDTYIISDKIEATMFGAKDYSNLFKYMDIQQPVKTALATYYNKITDRYRYKVTAVLSGQWTYNLLHIIRYKNNNYVLTGIKYNQINDTTELEMLGSVCGY